MYKCTCIQLYSTLQPVTKYHQKINRYVFPLEGQEDRVVGGLMFGDPKFEESGHTDRREKV